MARPGTSRPLATGRTVRSENGSIIMVKAIAPAFSGPEREFADLNALEVAGLSWPESPSWSGLEPSAQWCARRAGEAARAVAEHCRVSGWVSNDLAVSSSMSDLISGLMHLADALGLDMDHLLTLARQEYRAETAGSGN